MAFEGHGGSAVALALKSLGVENLFTLTGGHIFPILDGCHQEGIRIVDTRHEQSATFAAEGWARLTRSLGVSAITAGPGVTNATSALAQAKFNSAPVLALAGRAPAFRWGQGSLQEIDHVPFIDPLAPARTVFDTASIGKEVLVAAREALTPPRGPRFLDFPLDVLFNNSTIEIGNGDGEGDTREPSGIEEVASLIAQAERPIIVAGSNVYLDEAEGVLRALVEKAGIPTYMNGQGRGCLPADHPLAYSRSRSAAMKNSDLVIVAGTPMDFRLGFGQGFGPDAKTVHIDAGPIAEHVDLAGSINAPTDAAFSAIAEALSKTNDTTAWTKRLDEIELEKTREAEKELKLDSTPIHPMRIYGELVPLLERDAIVIGDGGDFVSYAGREIPSYTPGCWLDPGPFGCLGVGTGYSMAARIAHPDRQVVALFGDGAIGFSGMELETLVRLKLPVVCVVGNNGIWGLEKHPMRALYGYDVAADLRQDVRYDRLMESFGGKGVLVEDPDQVGPALKQALSSGEPTLVNILTDPEVAYPRSANLA
jgi:acetolactate synthase-1/2/3 large subunit